MKTGKASGSSEVSLELIAVIRGVGIQVIDEINIRKSSMDLECQKNGL